ncbi:hypothetical protein PERMA_A0015 (plasmid) [Persephonella marina EX-H1]|uniref:Uncharacterized protein n=1 Tax=Persephonella marina (strain DSM 14350 / EX-H1) TaxID=123214 RepID=C0QUU4_PERMH|nr:hypothetical protein [Persephonella marina]ACO05011.1 hypothetical protein PERMA_A0015 [Persephonella marina EX-H1]
MDKSLLIDIISIGNRAVRKAQQESLKKGIPNVYCKNGKFYFELPDGTITTEVPDIYKNVFKRFKKENASKK